MMDDITGIVYLIQPAELVGTNRYKIGCSRDTNLSRLINGYKKGSRYIIIRELNNPFDVESMILNTFRSKFSIIAGNEYFQGIEIDMSQEFNKIVDEYIISSLPTVTEKLPIVKEELPIVKEELPATSLDYIKKLSPHKVNKKITPTSLDYMIPYINNKGDNTPNHIKFLRYMKGSDDTFTATQLYTLYKNWCQDNGERNIQSSTKFGSNIKNLVNKRRSNKGMIYDLKTIDV